MGKPEYNSVPRLIGTFNFSDFTVASATSWKRLSNTLSRKAVQRTFLMQNTLDQPTTTSITAQMYDSTMNASAINTPGVSMGGAMSANGQMVETSEYFQRLATHCDSITIGVPMGATLPTTGQVSIWVVEFFVR